MYAIVFLEDVTVARSCQSMRCILAQVICHYNSTTYMGRTQSGLVLLDGRWVPNRLDGCFSATSK